MDTNTIAQITQAVSAAVQASPEGTLVHQALQLGPMGIYAVLFWMHTRTKRLEESLGRIENHLGTIHLTKSRRP